MAQAYILITAEASRVKSVVDEVRLIQGVKTASAITGPFDAIALVEGNDLKEIGEMVVARIQKIDGVSRTLTCFVVEF